MPDVDLALLVHHPLGRSDILEQHSSSGDALKPNRKPSDPFAMPLGTALAVTRLALHFATIGQGQRSRAVK